MSDDARPFPKSQQLARGRRRYPRKVASPKQWQAIIAEKQAPCRVCTDPGTNGRLHPRIRFHHVVHRSDGGDDVAANIVPLCDDCHAAIHRRVPAACRKLIAELWADEYAYMVERGGADYPERVYGIRYER
ncbi:MAG: HNH endonuclease signature motif containing protein [Mycobacterium sp.]